MKRFFEDELNNAVEIINAASNRGQRAEVRFEVDGLRVTVKDAYDGIGYSISGLYLPEAVEADPIQ